MNRAIRLSGRGLPERGQETTKYLEQFYILLTVHHVMILGK